MSKKLNSAIVFSKNFDLSERNVGTFCKKTGHSKLSLPNTYSIIVNLWLTTAHPCLKDLELTFSVVRNAIFSVSELVNVRSSGNGPIILMENKTSIFCVFESVFGHSTPDSAKFLRFGHDPSQNLIKICQVVTIYKIW